MLTLTAFQGLYVLVVLSCSLLHEGEEGDIYPALSYMLKRLFKPTLTPPLSPHEMGLDTAKGVDSQETSAATDEANSVPVLRQFGYLQSIFILADWLTWDDVLRAFQQWPPRDGRLRKSFLTCGVVAPGPTGVRVWRFDYDRHLVPRDFNSFIYIWRLPSWPRPKGSCCSGYRPSVAMLLKDNLLPLVAYCLWVPRGAWKLDTVSIVIPIVCEVRGPLVNGRYVENVRLVGVRSGNQRGKLI